jgi:hypothetical protein
MRDHRNGIELIGQGRMGHRLMVKGYWSRLMGPGPYRLLDSDLTYGCRRMGKMSAHGSYAD